MPTIDLVDEAYELQIDSAATGGISKLHFGSESERFSRLEKERNDFLLKRTPFSYALSTNRTIGDTLVSRDVPKTVNNWQLVVSRMPKGTNVACGFIS